MLGEQLRRGGRDARRAERTSTRLVSLPALQRRIPTWDILAEEGVERLHRASLALLEEVGIDFRDDEAADIWRDAGAEVAGHRVRIPGALLMELVSRAPERFTVHARNPARSVEVGGDKVTFAPTYGSPFVMDLDGLRRYGTMADLEAFHKLAYMAPVLHNTGSVVCEPVDLPVPRRHLHITRSAIRHSDKPFMGSVTAPERAADTVRMAEIVFGAPFIADRAVMISLVNCNSPLVWDETMLGALKVYARAHQAVIVAPFVLAGANTPASTAACVAQLNAEALAGIAFAQLVRPGAPVLYGHFLAAVSMRTGAPMAGTPEIAFMNLLIGQLARRYRLPLRSSGMIAGSKLVDAQAGYESVLTMYPVMLSGANFVLHAAGWNEAGLSASFAKFVLDCEVVEMFYRLGQGVRLDDLDEAMMTVREVGPGGHFLGTAHTQENFQSAFFMPEVMDNNNFEAWQAAGGEDADARARALVRRRLAGYEPPPLDPAIAEALDDFVARREQELPERMG
jgi:trimethylamine---corrinoid protein Co-methyltransferase